MLANLAWLDRDGQIHTVQQPSNGMPLLGASAPMGLDLQNLAWLGDDGQVHTVQQYQNGQHLLGATYQPTMQNLDG